MTIAALIFFCTFFKYSKIWETRKIIIFFVWIIMWQIIKISDITLTVVQILKAFSLNFRVSRDECDARLRIYNTHKFQILFVALCLKHYRTTKSKTSTFIRIFYMDVMYKKNWNFINTSITTVWFTWITYPSFFLSFFLWKENRWMDWRISSEL